MHFLWLLHGSLLKRIFDAITCSASLSGTNFCAPAPFVLTCREHEKYLPLRRLGCGCIVHFRVKAHPFWDCIFLQGNVISHATLQDQRTDAYSVSRRCRTALQSIRGGVSKKELP